MVDKEKSETGKEEAAKDKEREPGSTASKEGKGTAEAAAEKAKELAGSASEKVKRITESSAFKSIGPLSWVGLGMALLFLFFMLIDAVNVRWWIMLPLGAGGLFVLWSRWGTARGKNEFESKVCLVGLIVLAAMIFFRDIWISHTLADVLDKLSGSGGVLDEMDKMFGK
jgi:hypothetical protein